MEQTYSMLFCVKNTKDEVDFNTITFRHVICKVPR